MRRVVPFLLLLLVAVGSAGGAGLGLRLGDEAREREAIAAEKAAVADYRERVRPVMRDLFLAMYVVVDLESAENVTRRDALLTTPEVRTLSRLARDVAKVAVPRSLAEDGRRMLRQLTDLESALGRISTGAQRSEFRKVAPELRGGYAKFTQVAGALRVSADALLGDGSTERFGQDRTVTVADYVVAANYACIDGDNALYDLLGKEGISVKAIREHGREISDAVDGTIDDLVHLAAPTALDDRHRTLASALDDARKFGNGARDLFEAARTRDTAAVLDAGSTFERGVARFAALSRDYRALHVTWCASYFNVGGPTAEPTS